MMTGVLRLATVGVLMFGCGIAVARTGTLVPMPIEGTECGSVHCGPAPYSPPHVDSVKKGRPVCPLIAGWPGYGGVQDAKARIIKEAKLTSGEGPALFSASTFNIGKDVDAFLAEAKGTSVVSTASKTGQQTVTVVAFGCTTLGSAKQYLNIPLDPKRKITLETLVQPAPSR